MSPKANALDEAIRHQDILLLAARAEGCPEPFVERIIAQRNDLVRELAYEWRRSEWERTA